MTVANFKRGSSKQLVCEACIADERAKEKKLRQLMKESKRQKCTCGSLANHKQGCLMHPKDAWERPFPGCDKMSREDSEWLAKRSKKR